jgi:peptide/nickel transport system substrate-binding protein
MDVFGMDYTTYTEKKDEISQINLVAYVDPCPRGAFFNTAKAPFDKAEFRRAMSMLMNRAKWGENIWVPPSKPAVAPWADYRNLDMYINQESNTKWGTLDYNPEKAMELLAELGYKDQGGKLVGPDGQQVKFEVGTPSGVGGFEYLLAQDWIEDLKAVGIDATLQNFEGPVWWGKVDTGDYDVGFWWLCGATIDPLELYAGFTSDRVVPIGETLKSGNEARLQDPELDAIVKKLAAINPEDPDALPLYMDAYDIWMRDAAAVPLIQTYYTTYHNTEYWDNMMSTDDLYTVPFNWWAQIQFLLQKLEAK